MNIEMNKRHHSETNLLPAASMKSISQHSGCIEIGDVASAESIRRARILGIVSACKIYFEVSGLYQ